MGLLMAKKSYYLIGDCHANQILKRAIEDLDFNLYGSGLEVFSHGGWAMRGFLKKIETAKDNFISEQAAAFRGKYGQKSCWVEKRQIKFSEIEDSENSVIIFFLGYIDIKNMLPLKNDSHKTITEFIFEIKKMFPKSLIQIIEPMPQFVISLYRDDENWTPYSYDQRRKQNDLFLQNLREIAKINGVEIIMSQSDILESFDTDIDNIREESSFFLEGKPTDNFLPHIYKGVWDNLKIILNLS